MIPGKALLDFSKSTVIHELPGDLPPFIPFMAVVTSSLVKGSSTGAVASGSCVEADVSYYNAE